MKPKTSAELLAEAMAEAEAQSPEEKRAEEQRLAADMAQAEIDFQQALEYTQDDKAVAARQRALRANMARALDRRFNCYEEFTPEEAAKRTKLPEIRIKAYLDKECLMGGSRVMRGANPDTFILLTGFE